TSSGRVHLSILSLEFLSFPPAGATAGPAVAHSGLRTPLHSPALSCTPVPCPASPPAVRPRKCRSRLLTVQQRPELRGLRRVQARIFQLRPGALAGCPVQLPHRPIFQWPQPTADTSQPRDEALTP